MRPTAAQLTLWKLLTSDPQFVNVAGSDSPEVHVAGPGRRRCEPVYGVFQQRYGISIAADRGHTEALLGSRRLRKACGIRSGRAAESSDRVPCGDLAAVGRADLRLRGAVNYMLEIAGTRDRATSQRGGRRRDHTHFRRRGARGLLLFPGTAQNAAGTGPANEVVLTSASGRADQLVVSDRRRLSDDLDGAGGGSITRCILEVGTTPGAVNLGGATLAASSTTLRTAVLPRGTYFLRVRAKNGSGTSAPSNEVRLVIP